MTNEQIDNTIIKLEALKAQKKAIDTAIKEEEGRLQEELIARGSDTVDTGSHSMKWTMHIRKTFDSVRFKKEQPDTYSDYIKESAVERFTYK